MNKVIITEIPSLKDFFHLLQNNTGLIILKLGATWCGPCKKIKQVVDGFFGTSPENVICGDIDVDNSVEFYSFLKSKRIVNGIPVLLCYKKGNTTYFPDDSITGALPNDLHQFFLRCNKHLNDAIAKNPQKNL